jgi:hypothetical protein
MADLATDGLPDLTKVVMADLTRVVTAKTLPEVVLLLISTDRLMETLLVKVGIGLVTELADGLAAQTGEELADTPTDLTGDGLQGTPTMTSELAVELRDEPTNELMLEAIDLAEGTPVAELIDELADGLAGDAKTAPAAARPRRRGENIMMDRRNMKIDNL